MASQQMNYVVITPVRNEAKHFGKTIASMLRQTQPPLEWIIVDDGSTDGTREMAEKAAGKAPWIRVIQRADRGFRKAGAGVVEAFYDGFKQLSHANWDYVVKLDGDLDFEADYFAVVTATFEAEENLGITGGDIYHYEGTERVIESRTDPAFHVRGANKAYRRACWEAINGLFSVTGWDTLDEVKANMLGWRTRRIPALAMLHLKPTGAADGSWKDAFKNGRGSYISGYHPLFLLARAARRALKRPYLVTSFGLCAGFFSSPLARVRQISDKALLKFLRQQQLRHLFGRPSLWNM